MADVDDARNRSGRYRRELENLEGAAAAGELPDRDRSAIAAYADAEQARTEHVGTVATYVNRLRTSAQRASKPLVDFETTDDVETLMEAHGNAGATAASTQNNYRSALRGFFAWLEDADTHGGNEYGFRTEITNVSGGRDQRAEPPVPLSPDELTRIRRAADHPREKTLAAFLIDTGVRVSVACQLRCGDVSVAGDGRFRRNPDGLGQSTSPDVTHALFESHRSVRTWLDEYHPEAPDPPSEAPLFPVKRGYEPDDRRACAVSPSAAADALESVAEAAGIDPARVRPRNWRWTSALRQRAVHDTDWETIRKRSGWSDDGISAVQTLHRESDAGDRWSRAGMGDGLATSDDDPAPAGDRTGRTDGADPSYCVDCGAELPSHGRFCPGCGVDLQRAVPASVTGNAGDQGRSGAVLLDRLSGVMRAVNEVLVAAGSRQSIMDGVTDALAGSDLYDGAWSFDETLTARRGGKDERGDFRGADVVETSLDGAERHPDDPDALPIGPDEKVDVRPEAGRWTSVPVVHSRTAYGTLVLFSTREDAFDDRELAILDAIGAQVGHAVNAAEKEWLLVSDTVVELELAAAGGDPLAECSRTAGATLSVTGIVPTDGREVVVYCSVDGDIHDAVAALSKAEGIGRLRPIDDATVECRLGEGSLVVPLREVGAEIGTVHADGGVATVTARVSPKTDVRAVLERVRQSVPETDLQAKRRREGGSETTDTRPAGSELGAELTDRQRETMEAAYSAGYFEWPRESTAEDVADEMGVSSPTVHNHLRKAENEVLGELLDG